MKKPLIYFVTFTFVLFLGVTGSLAASDNAANKVHATGSTLWEFGPQSEVTLLSTSVKTSNVADLLIEFNAECSIYWHDYDLIDDYYYGSDYDSMSATVVVWVEVDGVPVPVDPSADPADNGQVVFCRFAETEYESIYSYGQYYYYYGDITRYYQNIYNDSRTANSFKWFTFDAGAGTHTVEVKAALLDYEYSLEGYIRGAVGRRTLVVEPLNNLK